MPLITIEMWEGRTVEQKKKIVEAVTQAMADAVGTHPESVWIIIRDVPKHNWGMKGKLCSET